MHSAEVFFAPGSAALTRDAIAKLAEFASKARGVHLEVIVAVGHADATETRSPEAALELSVSRVQAIKDYLVQLGVEPNRVYVEGKGRTQPVADNKTAEGRAKNRRGQLEVVGVRKAGAPGHREDGLPKGHVPVLFGTNRAKTGKSDPAQYFSSNESEAPDASRLTLGRVTVRVPPERQKGELKEPGFIRVVLETITSSATASFVGIQPVPAADLRTDFSFVGPLEELNEGEFATALKASIAASRSKSALVYVHGFANSFKDAAFRTAQFAYDLADEQFDVVPVLFSWPSDPSVFNYIAAGDRAWSAGKQLAVFLGKLTETTGAEVIHVVAHSKGAQVLGVALDEFRTSNLLVLGKDGRSLKPRFRQIILAAPDIRASDFQRVILPAVASKHVVTNYVSSNDAALRVAKTANAGARAGDSGETAILVNGVETIDVTKVNYEPGGHSSFAESPSVIADIRQQLNGKKPADRHLQRIPRHNLEYWLLLE